MLYSMMILQIHLKKTEKMIQYYQYFCYYEYNIVVVNITAALISGQAGVPSLITKRARIEFSLWIKTSFRTIFATRMFTIVHLDRLRFVEDISAKWTACIHQFSTRSLFRCLGRRRNKFLRNHLIPKTGNLHQWYWRIHNWAPIDQFQSEIRCSVFYQVLGQILKGYFAIDEFHFRRLKYTIIETGMSQSIPILIAQW